MHSHYVMLAMHACINRDYSFAIKQLLELHSIINYNIQKNGCNHLLSNSIMCANLISICSCGSLYTILHYIDAIIVKNDILMIYAWWETAEYALRFP